MGGRDVDGESVGRLMDATSVGTPIRFFFFFFFCLATAPVMVGEVGVGRWRGGFIFFLKIFEMFWKLII